MTEDEVEVGQKLAGKYLVERVIGRGGMGVVVVALHEGLHERVAIKILARAALGNADAASRFKREARVGARIRSDHVPRVMDVGELESGALYIVMEYLKGEDLAQWLKSHGPLPAEQAVEFVLQACVALADAHALGVVHRDIKPANLFCERRSDGQLWIKVLDFGVSKLSEVGTPLDFDEGLVTRTATIVGTPLYMSPEQVRSSRLVDARSDIWSLGVVLFELLAGRPPFSGQAFGDVAVKIASEAPPRLSSYRPDLPRGLEALVLRCLEKERERRFGDVAELARALRSFSNPRGVALVERIEAISRSATRIAPEVSPAEPVEPQGTEDPHATQAVHQVPGTIAAWASRGPSVRSNKRRLWLGVSSGVALIAAGALGISWILGEKETEAEVATMRSARPEPSSTSVPPPPAVPVELSFPKPSAQSSAEIKPGEPPARLVPNEDANRKNSESKGGRSSGPADNLISSRPSPSIKNGTLGTPSPLPAKTSGPVKQDECNPPYTTDAQGRKIFKRQCFKTPVRP